MLVTLEFSVNGIEYKIERGRKPNLLKFYVNDQQKSADDAQGENKETQVHIEKVINMSVDMFRHIVALNTYSEPFLALKANEQRAIIEQLLGITLLSEKADVVKELIRSSKDNIQAEEFRVKAVDEANKRVREQIDSLKRRQTLWTNKHASDLAYLVSQYDELSKIDIEKELLAHKDLVVWNEKKKQQDAYNSLLARQVAWKQKQTKDLSDLENSAFKMSHIDIVAEILAHRSLAEYNIKTTELAARDKEIIRLQKDIDSL
jgi:DNA repair exonuclease SbcCD ATPase subunit